MSPNLNPGHPPNRWSQSGGNYNFSATFTGNNPSNPANTNRIDGYTYDAAGNLTYDGVHHYYYDAENRLTQLDGTVGACATNPPTAAACYIYDALGHRTRRTGDTDPDNCYNTGNQDYVYDLQGRWIANFNYNGGECDFEIYAGSRHLGSVINGTAFSHADWLGTERVRTSYEYISNRAADQHCTSLPFGDGLSCNALGGSTLHFTGKERDYESGLDNFIARYNASAKGRFMSPDPSNLGVDFYLPQTWNRYAYALNNPLTMLDHNGFWPAWVHNDIIDKSFPTLSSGQRDILQKQSAAVDEDQSVAGSYKHGMVGEGCDGCFDAQGDAQKTADWISQNEHDAEELQQQWIDSGHTGLCPAALQAFGNALHTITDMTSPSHEGGQHWRDNYGDLRTYWHVLREIVPTDANKRRQQTAIQNAQRAFWLVFGSSCHTEQTTTTILDSNGNAAGSSTSSRLVCN